MFKSIIRRWREWRVSLDRRRQVRRFGMVIDHPADSIVNAVKSRPDCITCLGEGWVCENHLGKPWGGVSDDIQACNCGGAGAPCFECNPSLHCGCELCGKLVQHNIIECILNAEVIGE